MDDKLAFFIIVMAVLTAATTLGLVWMGIRHREKSGDAGDTNEARREISLLTDENADLRNQVSRLEERLAVLERIATDPAERTAREIEQLRHG